MKSNFGKLRKIQLNFDKLQEIKIYFAKLSKNLSKLCIYR